MLKTQAQAPTAQGAAQSTQDNFERAAGSARLVLNSSKTFPPCGTGPHPRFKAVSLAQYIEANDHFKYASIDEKEPGRGELPAGSLQAATISANAEQAEASARNAQSSSTGPEMALVTTS